MMLRFAAALLAVTPIAAQTLSNPAFVVGEAGIRRTIPGQATDEQTITGAVTGEVPLFLPPVPGGEICRATLTQTDTSFTAYQFHQVQAQPIATCETIGGPAPAQADLPMIFTGTLSSSQPVQGAIYVRGSFFAFGPHELTMRVSVLGNVFEPIASSGQLVNAIPVTLDSTGVTWTMEFGGRAFRDATTGGSLSRLLSQVEVGFSTDRCYTALAQQSCPAGGLHDVLVSGPNGDMLDFAFNGGNVEPAGALLLSPFGATLELPLIDAPRCHLLAIVPVAIPVTFTNTEASFTLQAPPNHVGSWYSQYVSIIQGIGIPKPSGTVRVDCVF